MKQMKKNSKDMKSSKGVAKIAGGETKGSEIPVNKRSKRKILFIGAGVLVLAIFLVVLFGSSGREQTASSGTSKPFFLTAENLPAHLEASGIAKDLPSNARIQIYFGDNAYHLLGSEIKEGEIEGPDMTVYVGEKYLNTEWSSICAAVKAASNDGEARVEMHASKASLLWKYKSVIKYKDKYKDCF